MGAHEETKYETIHPDLIDLEQDLSGFDDKSVKEEDDLEAQAIVETRQLSIAPEYEVSTSRKLLFLGLYFLLNLGVTLSNKAILRKASFPWLLTFFHTLSTSIGCLVLLATGRLKLSKLSLYENLILTAFSTLFTLNIAISNVSLSLVSVPFHQVMRSACPVVTVLIYRLFYGRTYSNETYLSLLPLIIGVGLATFGDYYFTALGFGLTFLGVILASVKTVTSNRLMTGSLKLPALEVLCRMSPLAAIQCLLYAAVSGELQLFRDSATQQTFSIPFVLAAVGNFSMAFLLNIVSFQTNKVAGALTISVCGNVKQCLTIILGTMLFDVRILPINGMGLAIASMGAAYYSKVELDRKRASTSV